MSQKSVLQNQKINNNGIDDKEIIFQEIKEAAPLLAADEKNKETLSDIFRRAAKRLEEYYDDKSVICARLSRIWKDESRLIRKALPDKYKRGYSPENFDETMPISELEELFMELNDVFEGMHKIAKRVLDKIKTQPHIQRKLLNGEELTAEEQKEFEITKKLQKIVLKSFGTSSEFKRFLEQTKKASEEAALLQNDFDDRLKLDDYRRVVIRVYNLMYKFRKTGKIWHKCGKWIKQIDEDPQLSKIIKDAGKCINCGHDLDDYFNKQALRIAKQLEPKFPYFIKTEWEKRKKQ